MATLEETVPRYLATTKAALGKIRVPVPENSYAGKIAADFLRMATSYYDDACHNHEVGNDVLAYAQVNYAHGWLDAGARLGVFDVDGDDRLFTLLD